MFAQGRPVFPQETCSMIAVADIDAAHYLAALLNSKAVHRRVAASSVQGGKGFGSPGMLEHLPVRRYHATDESHLLLAQLGRSASECLPHEHVRLLAEIDRIVDLVLESK